jgi:predicted DNA-binding protein
MRTRDKHERAFRRDDHLSIRLPVEDNERLVRLAEKKRRDTSNLALEFIAEGMRVCEQQLRGSDHYAPSR